MDKTVALDPPTAPRTLWRRRTSEEILADIPPEVREARRIIREGGDPGPMPIDRFVYFGSKIHQELVKNRPDFKGLVPPDFDVDRPGDLKSIEGSLILGPMPEEMPKVRTNLGEVFVRPQDLALIPQHQWITKSGVQVITGAHGEECCCVPCCCEEPEPTAFFHPRDVCPCEVNEPLTIGIFIDGQALTSDSDEWDKHKEVSGIRDLCARYPHSKRLYVGYFGALKTKNFAEDLANELEEEICRRSRWDGESWHECYPVTIDLFGFSRGGATAVLIAKYLNEKWRCERCPDADPLGPARVRFLGVVDPYGSIVPNPFYPLTKPPVKSMVETTKLPGNVEIFYSAYSDTQRGWTQVASAWTSEHFPELGDRTINAGNMFDLDHYEMDDASNPPMTNLRDFFQESTGVSMEEVMGGCSVENPDAEPKPKK